MSRPYESLKRPQKMEELFYEQIQALAEGGTDLIILDTFSDIEEAKGALRACRRVGDLPVVCNFSFLEDGKTLTGLTPEEAAQKMHELGATIVGSNCGIGAQGVLEAIERMRSHFEGVLSAFPNAGLPKFVGGRFPLSLQPKLFCHLCPQVSGGRGRHCGGMLWFHPCPHKGDLSGHKGPQTKAQAKARC